jgi:hypothetical protein
MVWRVIAPICTAGALLSYEPIQSPLISTASEGDREIQIIDHAKPTKSSPP